MVTAQKATPKSAPRFCSACGVRVSSAYLALNRRNGWANRETCSLSCEMKRLNTLAEAWQAQAELELREAAELRPPPEVAA